MNESEKKKQFGRISKRLACNNVIFSNFHFFPLLFKRWPGSIRSRPCYFGCSRTGLAIIDCRSSPPRWVQRQLKNEGVGRCGYNGPKMFRNTFLPANNMDINVHCSRKDEMWSCTLNPRLETVADTHGKERKTETKQKCLGADKSNWTTLLGSDHLPVIIKAWL